MKAQNFRLIRSLHEIKQSELWKVKPDKMIHVGSHSIPSSTASDKKHVCLNQCLSFGLRTNLNGDLWVGLFNLLCFFMGSMQESFFLPVLGVKQPGQKLNPIRFFSLRS